MPLFLRYNNYINDYIKFQSSLICKPVSKLEVIFMHRAWAACGLPRTNPATGGPDVVYVKWIYQYVFSFVQSIFSDHFLCYF